MTAVPAHLILSEDEVALLVLGPERVKEWPAKRRALEKEGFPKFNKYWGGWYREQVEAFVRADFCGPEKTGDPLRDEYVSVVPFAEDCRENDHAPKALSADRRRRNARV